MKKIRTLLLAHLLLATHPAIASSPLLRESLAALPEVESVVPLGRTMTLVTKGSNSLFTPHGVTDRMFHEAVASVCSAGWMFTTNTQDAMTGRVISTSERQYGKQAAENIFKVGGTECAQEFQLVANLRNTFMGQRQPVMFKAFVSQSPVWKGKAKAIYEQDDLPPNGRLDGKTLGANSLMVNGLESLAWSYAKCSRRGGEIALFAPGNGVIRDESRIVSAMAYVYTDPYQLTGRYLEGAYFLGCRGSHPFVLKVDTHEGRVLGALQQEILFEDGRDIDSVR